MTKFPELFRSQTRFLVAAILIVSPILTQQSAPPTKPSSTKQPASKTSVLLIDTDDTCRLLVDGEDKGVISPDHSQKFNVTIGEHILKCTVETVPDLVWRKVVDAKDSSQVAAVITLKALHIQYGQAEAKVKSQKDEADAAAGRRLKEAEAAEKEREAAKADAPKKMFELVKGEWKGVLVTENPPPIGTITSNVDVRFEFEGGVIVAFWTDLSLPSKKRRTFQFKFTPVPPNLLKGIEDYSGAITIINENRLEFRDATSTVTFTR
jgi:hypothetical protein